MERLVCLAAGYLCGCFLTAEIVAHYRTGQGAASLGTGNPGTANVVGHLGIGWGALVLLGDAGKTALALAQCRFWLAPGLGMVGGLYAGLGAVLGHNFPVWRRFCGGKGVAVTCAAIVLVSPLWGAVSCLAGLAAVLLSGYLPLGAVLIPCLFIFPAFAVHGVEPGILSAVLAILMVIRHIHGLERIASHTEKKFGPRRT